MSVVHGKFFVRGAHAMMRLCKTQVSQRRYIPRGLHCTSVTVSTMGRVRLTRMFAFAHEVVLLIHLLSIHRALPDDKLGLDGDEGKLQAVHGQSRSLFFLFM